MKLLLDLAQENAYLSAVKCLNDTANLLDRFHVDVGLSRDIFFETG